MYSISDLPNISPTYIPYPEYLEKTCLVCGENVEFVYVTSGHSYVDFDGSHNDSIRLYKCINSECSLFEVPINPTPPQVFPKKRFSLSIWKWVAKEAKFLKQAPDKICERIASEFDIKISESTVRAMIKEIDAFLCSEIDKDTLEILKKQGIILIALDGQKPDDKGDALWLFVDLISNRVLDVKILSCADHQTLHEIIENILSRYGVKLVGGVSDKQNNITKMHETFYEDLPWQYCHFHFLQNLWNHIETKDGHLHKELKKCVNNLYILRVEKSRCVNFDGLGKVSIREMFEGVEKQLRAILRVSTKKFKKLRGITVFRDLKSYADLLVENLQNEDNSRKVVSFLQRTLSDITKSQYILESEYDTCIKLEEEFHIIRKILGDPNLNKQDKQKNLDEVFSGLWNDVKGYNGIDEVSKCKSFKPKWDTPYEKIKQEWVRLYHSYRPGLLSYYDFPLQAKTNTTMERSFGIEKMELISKSGKTRIGSMIRTHGPMILKQVYAGKEKIREILNDMETRFDAEEIEGELRDLQERTSEETARWRNRIFKENEIEKVLMKGRTTKK